MQNTFLKKGVCERTTSGRYLESKKTLYLRTHWNFA